MLRGSREAPRSRNQCTRSELPTLLSVLPRDSPRRMHDNGTDTTQLRRVRARARPSAPTTPPYAPRRARLTGISAVGRRAARHAGPRVRHNRRTSGGRRGENGVRQLGRLALDVNVRREAQAFIFAVIGQARGASRPSEGWRTLALSNVVKWDGWQRGGKVWQAARMQEGVRPSSTYVG